MITRSRHSLAALARLLVGLVFATPAFGVHAGTAAGSNLCVMTYNLRFASERTPNAWTQRRPLVRDVIQLINPDVLGTQEGLYSQLKDLAADLPGYDWIGLGRDGGSRGEFMAVFYRKARLEPLAFDHFWLSDTPEVIGSSSWGNHFPRLVTWVKFRDQLTQDEFVLFNTHFDHESQKAREQSAQLVRQRVAALEPRLPVVLIGDFNAAAETNRAYTILTESGFFTDAWLAAAERRGEGFGTFNDFKAPVPNGPRIDWILTRGSARVERVEISTFTRDGQFPSDHFPVAAWLHLGPAR
jgi:endonuclease/exonuclease/phosphatase family metal-dependent hydrolase